jgi:uncharacterized protein (TIGR02246 family)
VPLDLPPLFATYLQATNERDAETLIALFAPDAVVTDEGREHRGTAAIRAWREETGKAYTYTAEAIAFAQRGDLSVLTATLTGDFPGSPTDLDFDFTLDAAGRIAALHIHA